MDDEPTFDPGEIREDEMPDILRNAVHIRGATSTHVNACLMAADELERLWAEVDRLRGISILNGETE
jgi:hypothetical protein